MKRLMQISAGIFLVISMTGCVFQPGYCDSATGLSYGGHWEPACGGPLDPFGIFHWMHHGEWGCGRCGYQGGFGYGGYGCGGSSACVNPGGCGGAGCQTGGIPSYAVPQGVITTPITPVTPQIQPTAPPAIGDPTTAVPTVVPGLNTVPIQDARNQQWIPARY